MHDNENACRAVTPPSAAAASVTVLSPIRASASELHKKRTRLVCQFGSGRSLQTSNTTLMPYRTSLVWNCTCCTNRRPLIIDPDDCGYRGNQGGLL